MPQAAVSLLDLYSDDSDEDMGYLPVPAQISKPIDSRKVGGLASVTTTTTTKKNASKNAALAPAASKTKVTKSGAKSVKEKAATGKKAAVARKPSREVLSERRSPNRSEDEIEMEDELGNEDVVEEPVQAKKTAKRGKKAAVAQKEDVDAAPAPAAKLTKKGRGKLEEEPAAPAAEQSKKSARGRPKGSKATTGAASVKPEAAQSVVPETQPEPELMDVEQSIEVDEFAEAQSELEPAPEPVEPTRRAARQPARQTSNQPASRRGQVNGKRAGSASDTERGGSGAEMRRRLGEMTKELDKLRLRYDDLRAVGVQDRESNFDRLKKSTDQREKDQNALIASLRKQLEAQKSLSADYKVLQKEVATLKSTNTRLTTEISKLNTSLTDAQNESKSLNARLSTLRAQSSEPKITGSAVKQRAGAGGAQLNSGFKDAEWQLKKDLFEDLTGLVVTNVKKTDGEIQYHCLQTGKNGALHFVLSQPSAPTNGESWDEIEIEYDPQLDDETGRDATLVQILPDFLRQGIAFPRNQSNMFFARMVKYMNASVQVVEQTEYSLDDDEVEDNVDE